MTEEVEYVPVWTAKGLATERIVLKSKAHSEGLYHPTVHLWLYSSSRKLLLQQRALNKDSFAGLWDVSVAGHMQAGETALEGVKRETLEELGLKIAENEPYFIGVYFSENKHSSQFIDREFQHVFIMWVDEDSITLKPDKTEVADLQWKSIDSLKTDISSHKSSIYTPSLIGGIDFVSHKINLRL